MEFALDHLLSIALIVFFVIPAPLFIVLYFIMRKKEEREEMPPLPVELTGEPKPQGPDDELEKLFQASYNGKQ